MSEGGTYEKVGTEVDDDSVLDRGNKP